MKGVLRSCDLCSVSPNTSYTGVVYKAVSCAAMHDWRRESHSRTAMWELTSPSLRKVRMCVVCCYGDIISPAPSADMRGETLVVGGGLHF